MNGLLELFGNAGGLEGLVTPDQLEANRKNALITAGLTLAAASQGGGAGGGRAALIPALLQGLQAGQQAFQSGIQNQVGNVLTAQKIKEVQRQQKLNELLLSEQERFNAEIGGSVSPQQALGAPVESAGRVGPTPERAALIGMGQAQYDPKAGAARLRQFAQRVGIAMPEVAEKYLKQADALDPRFKTQSVQELNIGGINKKFAVGDDGSLREIGVAPEDLMQVNLGNQIALVGKNTGRVLSQYATGMTPDGMAANAVAQRNAATNEGNLALNWQKFAAEQAQGKAPPEAFARQAMAYKNMSKALDEYESNITSGGITAMPTEKKQRLATQYQDLLLQAKEMYALGVLNGPDLEILQKVLVDPTSIGTNFNPMRGADSVKNNIAEVKKILERSRESLQSTYNRAVPQYTPAEVPKFNPSVGKGGTTAFGLANLPLDAIDAELARRNATGRP